MHDASCGRSSPTRYHVRAPGIIIPDWQEEVSVTAPAPAIDAHGLRKSFRRGLRQRLEQVTAVDGIDLLVHRGSVFGLLGPNGAGKTTVIHMLLGLVRPGGGTANVLGGLIGDSSVRRRIGYVPEKFQLPPFLTARQFLALHGDLHGSLPRGERSREVDRCIQLAGLTDRVGDVVGSFSKGMQQRLAIAQALYGSPELVILDEPTSALDPIGRKHVREILDELHAGGTTVVLNSHLLTEVEQVSDEVAIIDRGRVIRQGPIATLIDGQTHVSARVRGVEQQLRGVLEGIVGSLLIDAGHADGVLELSFTAVDEDAVSDAATAIIGAGAQLLRLDPHSESLEDAFIRLVTS